MDSLIRYAKETREYLTPLLSESKFESDGILTPSEFILAGDQLVATNPMWQWKNGNKDRIRSYLPVEKQFLVCKGCPSNNRVFELENAATGRIPLPGESECCSSPSGTPPQKYSSAGSDSSVVDPDRDHRQDTWHETGEADNWHDVSEKCTSESTVMVDLFSSLSLKPTSAEDLVDETILSDPSSLARQQTRMYDLSICYDNFYRTPRLFLFGNDSSGVPISHFAMFQDCVIDYVKKTVTVEMHPHMHTYMLSVHPCKVGETMKKMIAAQKRCGIFVSAEQYMFLYLKFVSAIIPTVEFDFTPDVPVNTSSK